MLLIEIFSENDCELFFDIPQKYHKEILSLYFLGLDCSINKPQCVKLCLVELIRIKFILNNYKSFNVMKLINDFSKNHIKKSEIKLGYIDDLNYHVSDYFFSK